MTMCTCVLGSKMARKRALMVLKTYLILTSPDFPVGQLVDVLPQPRQEVCSRDFLYTIITLTLNKYNDTPYLKG